VREAQAADRAAIVDVYNHYVEHTAITFDLTPFTVATRAPWFETFGILGEDRPAGADAPEEPPRRHRLLVIEDATLPGGIGGYACSGPLRPKAAYDRSVETTVYLHPDARGRGLGRTLYGALLDALAASDVHRCYGVITLPNDASMALHARLGFREVGRLTECGRKFDRWWDVVWMERGL
jgi:phosphinothricin acetyltransferase